MGKKKKVSSPVRSSARLNGKKQSLDAFSVAKSGSSSSNNEVDLASSPLASGDAQSTSSQVFKEVFEALEAGSSYKEHAEVQSKAKADLVKSLTLKTSSRIPSSSSRMDLDPCYKHSKIELAKQPSLEAYQSEANGLHNPYNEAFSASHGAMAEEEDRLGSSFLPDGHSLGMDKGITQEILQGGQHHGSFLSAPSNQNLTTHTPLQKSNSDSIAKELQARDPLEDFPPLEGLNSNGSAGPTKQTSGPLLNDMDARVDANKANNATQAQATQQHPHRAESHFHFTKQNFNTRQFLGANPRRQGDQNARKGHVEGDNPSTRHNAWNKPPKVRFEPTPNEPYSDWGGVFAEYMETNLKFEEEHVINFVEGNRIVQDPPEDLYEDGDSFWTHCLVGQFLGAPPPLFLIRNMVNFAWWKFGKVEIFTKGKGLIIFKFEKEEYCQKVLQQLWHVNHRPLLLRKWEPNLEFVNLSCKKVPLWVKLWNVPMSLYSKRGLGYVASFIGKPIQMDALTESRRNLEFARVCIEVDLDDKLPDAIFPKLRNGTQSKVDVEYAWRPIKCSHCKVVGHVEEKCPRKPNAPPPLKNFQKQVPKVHNEWQVVERKHSSLKIQDATKTTKEDVQPSIKENLTPRPSSPSKFFQDPTCSKSINTNLFEALDTMGDVEEGELQFSKFEEATKDLESPNAKGYGNPGPSASSPSSK